MNIGEILVYLNPLLILAAIYFGYKNFNDKSSTNERNFNSVSYLILGNHTFLLLLLTYYFLTTNLKFEYVSDYTASDHSIGYKIAGVWAGRDGTLLIWAWATSLTLVLERIFHKEKELQRELTSTIGMVLLLALCVIPVSYTHLRAHET